MKNKVILITGANKGIGKTLSLEFSKMGVNIVLLGRNFLVRFRSLIKLSECAFKEK